MGDAKTGRRMGEAAPIAQGGSPGLSPNDHLRLLVELLRPSGAELTRRWVTALLTAPEADREEIVASVERRMAEVYPAGARGPALRVRGAATRRDGHTEETVREYERAPEAPARPKARRKTGA